MTGNLQGYSCPRCKKNFGFVFFHLNGNQYFCGDYECLQSDATYGKKNDKSIKIEEPRDASTLYGLGTRYYNASLSKMIQSTQTTGQLLNWLKSPKNMLFIRGVPGTAKTYFCAAAANWLLEKGQEVRYINNRRFFENIQYAIGQGQNQFYSIDKISQAKFLIFDDLGSSSCSEWQVEMVLDLVDRRYSSQLPTIFTSNLSEKIILEKLGERTHRRLFSDDNLCIVFDKVYGGQ